MLPTVRVTGEKLRRDRQKSYTSTGVITDKEIEDLGHQDLRDALQLQGNVYVAPSNNGNNGISIRGINSEGIGEPGPNPRPLTTLVIDGAPQSFEGTRRGQRGTWDVEQIEVLRGPQSTLQGRNSLAGAIIVRTRDPSRVWEGALRLTAGQRNLLQPAFMLSGPILDGQLAFRIAGETSAGHKGITYSTPFADALDDDEYRNLRGKLSWRPDALPGFELKFTRADTLDDPSVTAVSGPDYFRRHLNVTASAVEKRENKLLNQILEANYEPRPGVVLTSVTALVETDARITTPSPQFVRNEVRGDSDITQELRLAYGPEGSRLSGVGGVFAGQFRNARDSLVRVRFTPAAPLTTFQNLESRNRIDNLAAFGELRYAVAPQWSLIGGARYETERFSNEFFNRITRTREDSAGDFEAFLPKAGVAWEFAPNRSVAFTATRGYRAGFVEVIANSSRNIAPEFLWSYDLAYRSVEQGGRLAFNANTFFYDWRDQQVSAPSAANPLVAITQNAGRSHSYGAEFSLAWRPTRRIDVGGSLGLLRTRIDEFPSSQGDFAGKEFPEAPRMTGGVWASARFGSGWFTSFDVAARGRAFATSDLANQASLRVPGRGVAALRLGYDVGTWSAVVFIENLFGHDYLTGRDIRTGAYVGDLRTAGVTLTARF